jgi:hypothetical protein
MTRIDQGGDVVELRKPAKRRQHPNSTRNLKQNSSASRTHGAQSETRVAPLREKHLADLLKTFPSANEHRLVIQAHRLAQLELLGAFTDARGVIRHKRRGDVFPAAALAERIATSFLAEQDRLEQQQREAGTNGRQTLADIEAELSEPDDEDGKSA